MVHFLYSKTPFNTLRFHFLQHLLQPHFDQTKSSQFKGNHYHRTSNLTYKQKVQTQGN